MSNLEISKDAIIKFIKSQATGKSITDNLDFLAILQTTAVAFPVQLLKSNGMSKAEVLEHMREQSDVTVCAFYDSAIEPKGN